MTMKTQPAATIIGTARTMRDQWCVYEHMVDSGDPLKPPQIIYIGACKLAEVFDMRDAQNNSDWTEIMVVDRPLIINIVATTPDAREAVRYAVDHIARQPQTPRCNLHGYNLHGQQRRLRCSNGTEYANQSEAARLLNVSQGAISRHLKGHLSTVKGYTFTYVTRTAR